MEVSYGAPCHANRVFPPDRSTPSGRNSSDVSPSSARQNRASTTHARYHTIQWHTLHLTNSPIADLAVQSIRNSKPADHGTPPIFTTPNPPYPVAPFRGDRDSPTPDSGGSRPPIIDTHWIIASTNGKRLMYSLEPDELSSAGGNVGVTKCSIELADAAFGQSAVLGLGETLWLARSPIEGFLVSFGLQSGWWERMLVGDMQKPAAKVALKAARTSRNRSSEQLSECRSGFNSITTKVAVIVVNAKDATARQRPDLLGVPRSLHESNDI
ncbi:uncharacterized protein BDR25DRAFT_352004 [Lindgomyces ingoldianus]|uniref:Uncharacterized protein n=1 Tax=Lindgomyces ingoldianus TaxID=673940 RepID=A0ACB6R5V6_9PLEO|nr:uncharacterized protein BDR25DRAFT_352004 [Lindgomyces ingoldianus]KAF2474452.1 hypothetical protein BDR25DRAFT_352004 [Lindgomyces ingoldianus]